MRSAKLNSGHDFSVESGKVSEKRCVLATSPADFLSFLVVGGSAEVASELAVDAPSAVPLPTDTSVVRAILFGSLI